MCSNLECQNTVFSKSLCSKHYFKLYRARNKEAIRLIKYRWFVRNNAHVKQTHSVWREKNKAHCRAQHAKRRASKLKATPPWVDLQKIEVIYASCPVGSEVDHIVPLQGQNVCGLHVHYNLQYLTRSENRRKRNKLLDPSSAGVKA